MNLDPGGTNGVAALALQLALEHPACELAGTLAAAVAAVLGGQDVATAVAMHRAKHAREWAQRQARDALQRAAARLALDPGWSSFGGDAALDAMAAEVSDVAVRAHPIFGEQDPPVPDGEVDKAARDVVEAWSLAKASETLPRRCRDTAETPSRHVAPHTSRPPPLPTSRRRLCRG